MKTLFANPYFRIIYSYLIIIFVGAIILNLPVSSYNLNFINSIFMATSAVCVTGLSVIDIGRELSFFGQIVLLALIQIGGLGIIIISSLIFIAVRKNMSLMDQSVIEESLNVDKKINIKKVIVFVVIITFIIELIGAVLLFFSFSNDYSIIESIYYAIFHSISAFCNAGFSLFTNSFENKTTNVFLNLTLVALIFLGGIGHFVFLEIYRNFKQSKFSFKKYLFSLNTRIAFKVSVFLIILGTVLIFIFERSNNQYTYGFFESLLASLFQSVSARTAGFSTINFSKISSASLIFICFLMMVGASPASCGGGIKTTTFYVLIKYFVANLKNRSTVFMGYRTVPRFAIKKAIIIYITYIFFLFNICLVLCFLEQDNVLSTNFNVKDLVFETFSALGTVGFSTGLTSYLSNPSKLVLSFAMFFGRTGIITLVSFFAFTFKEERFQYPEEDIFIG